MSHLIDHDQFQKRGGKGTGTGSAQEEHPPTTPLSSSAPASITSPLLSSLTPSSSHRKKGSYDVSRTMIRLRDSMGGSGAGIGRNRNLDTFHQSNHPNTHNNTHNNSNYKKPLFLDQEIGITGSSQQKQQKQQQQKQTTEVTHTNTNNHKRDYDTFQYSPGSSSSLLSLAIENYNHNNDESKGEQSTLLGKKMKTTKNHNHSHEINYNHKHGKKQHDNYDKKHDNNEENKTKHESKYNRDKNIQQNQEECNHSHPCYQKLTNAFHQIPAVALIAIFHLMIGIPFGVSYFPIGWREESQFNSLSSYNGTAAATTTNEYDGSINGPFPIQGKNSLGIRMFLFSTIIGQIIFTFQSGFTNPIGLQMVENVPFCQALAATTIKHCGYGIEALSTLFVMFGLSSILVGILFFTLGKFELGRVIYFFPSHVLVGLIAGIGIFICRTGIEVTLNTTFSYQAVINHFDLLIVVVLFECLLRILEGFNSKYGKNGKPFFSLLSPIYFCSITPIFYFILWCGKISVEDAERNGYFFPSLVNDCNNDGGGSNGSSCSDSSSSQSSSAFTQFLESTIFNENVFDMWKVIDFRNVSWVAVRSSIPTLMAITIFSLIHVPINIPAFAVSTNSEYDINQELIAHGYSNCISGCFGGLQNYMAYTQSILYDRSGGNGKPSGVAVAIVTAILYFIGPHFASYIPRCMAGTLLVHVGIDLFLEGVYDTIDKFERLEYAGIWLIAVVMTIFGMDAAMIAGAIAAVSTYTVQTVAYLDPVRGHMSATTLRSSHGNRGFMANSVLSNAETGRSKILVIQLQGHLFFGNVSQLNQNISKILKAKQSSIKPFIVIVDFSLVLGIDSSAAQAIVKVKKVMLDTYDIKLCVFVPGSSDGFPCEYKLSSELYDNHIYMPVDTSVLDNILYTNSSIEETAFMMHSLHQQENFKYEGSQVCQTLDFALTLSENALVVWHDPNLLENDMLIDETRNSNLSEEDEKNAALFHLGKIFSRIDVSENDVELMFSFFEQESYKKDEMLWRQGSKSDCAKLLVSGKLIAMLENEAGTCETVQVGRMVGELGLVAGINRMNSLFCLSDKCVVYSISKESFEKLADEKPNLARIMDLICIGYLADRVQHVSNRIFETRCLPI